MNLERKLKIIYLGLAKGYGDVNMFCKNNVIISILLV